MPHDDDSAKTDQSQVAAKDLTAGRDLQIGQIVQKIVYLGLPDSNDNLSSV